MLGEIVGKDRIRLDLVPQEIPSPPKVNIRSEGFFGTPNGQDKDHLNRVLDTRYMAIESDFALFCETVFALRGQTILSTAAQTMEETTEELRHGSLGREMADKICGFNAQILAETHVALMRNFAQSSLTIISRGRRQ